MSNLPQPMLIGMVHLPPLPGSPGHRSTPEEIVAHAVADARTLADTGFNALLVENFGDAPFTPERVPPATIASMTMVAWEIHRAVDLPLGINALRNDAAAALGIAVAVGGAFIRVNVHVGVAATDQGMIEGRAHDTLRLRDRLGADVRIFADVHVKHARPISQPDLALAAEETARRGRADALIISGPTTGRGADPADVRRVKEAVPDVPVLVGSGVTAETVRAVLAVADGVIVGTSLKPGADTAAPVDRGLAEGFIAAARAGDSH